MSQNLENLRDGPPGKISSTHGITILKDTLRITSEMVLRMSFKVVQIQMILFLKSMPERSGYAIQRL